MEHAGDKQRSVVLVTGATGGLCAGVAERLAQVGYRVVVATRHGGGDPAAVLARMRAFDPGAGAQCFDWDDPAAVDLALQQLEATHGPLYAAIHGRGPMKIGLLQRSTREDAQLMLAENLMSGILLAQAVLPGMRARGTGRLLFFGMTGSSVTRPARGLALYGAAKAGLVAFARTLALEEAAAGITVNVLEPGDIRDKTSSREQAQRVPAANPTGHAGSWEDIADAACFLLSPQASFINGSVLGIGGGLTNASE